MPIQLHLVTPRQLSRKEVHDIEAAWDEAQERRQDETAILQEIAARFDLRLGYTVVVPCPAS